MDYNHCLPITVTALPVSNIIPARIPGQSPLAGAPKASLSFGGRTQ